MSKIALIDLDGTLADYDKAMSDALDALAGPDERDWRTYAWTAPHLVARREYIASRPGFWRNLPPIADGFAVLANILDVGFDIVVCSKGPSHKSAAWAEKVDWVRQHLGEVPITLTEDKSLSYGRVLFDDWPKYYEPWLDVRPRGLVIAMARPQNVVIPEKYQRRVIRCDGPHNLMEIRQALVEAYDR